MQQDTDGEAGGRYRSYHPLKVPLSNRQWAAVPLAASPAAFCPMTAALSLPFQASVHDESTPRLSVRDMGKCTWQWTLTGISSLVVLAPSFNSTRPRDLYPCSAHLDRLPDSGDKNRGFHANSRLGHTVVSDAMSPVLQALVGYRSPPASGLSTLPCKQ